MCIIEELIDTGCQLFLINKKRYYRYGNSSYNTVGFFKTTSFEKRLKTVTFTTLFFRILVQHRRLDMKPHYHL
jgi:hypothetical protein